MAEHSRDIYVPRKGDRWRVFYILESGALYSWDTKVLDVIHANIHLIRVTRPRKEDVSKIQRREFFRMPLRLKVTLETEDGASQLHGETINISGGGMAVSCPPNTPAKRGDRLRGTLALPPEDEGQQGETEVPVTVEVVRVDPVSADGNRTIGYCKFIELEPKNQAAIIRLCNKRQRELHLKGLDQ